MLIIKSLLQQIKERPETLDFEQVLSTIDAYYQYTPRQFDNGPLDNPAGSNEGSCRIFAFAILYGLSEQQTLACFGRFYREDVLANPKGDSHQNIRQFMQTGWGGIRFSGSALKLMA